MMPLLIAFSALSMAGTVVLSLLKDGGMKRTAALAIGLLTLMCWAEGIAALLGIELELDAPDTLLTPTAYSVRDAEIQAASTLSARLEESP